MGIWDTLFLQPILNGLLVFYHVFFNNLGLAIIALTVSTRLILTPLVLPSMKAMQKMREFTPDLNKLKQKYKDDKKKLMQAQADFYKSKGINPASGCLPQIAQLVILIALFQVFTQTLPVNGDAIEKINKLAYPPFSLKEPLNTGFLYLNLARPDVFHAPGFPFPIPGPFLLAAALVQFLSSKMLAPTISLQTKEAKKTPSGTDDMMAGVQQQMLYFFPLMTIFIGFTFASGLVIYWFVFSLFQLVQQYLTSGWGGLAPWIHKLGLVKSDINGKTR